MLWIIISGGNIKKSRVSARNVLGSNYYLYLSAPDRGDYNTDWEEDFWEGRE